MTEMIIDLTNYKDRVGARVSEGVHTVVVADVEQDTSKAKNPMINVWYTIQGGEFDGLTIVDRLTLTEKAMFRVVGFMQAIGYKTPNKKFKVNIASFVGKRLQIEVADGEPYNGRVKSEVKGYLRVGTSGDSSGDSGEDLADLSDLTPPADDLAADDGGDIDLEAIESMAETIEAAPEEIETAAPEAEAETVEVAEPETVDLEAIDLS